MALTLGQFKASFFDRDLGNAIDRGAKRVLSKFGSFVWRRDKSSLKYRPGKSDAGKPPSVHRSKGFTRTKKNRKTGAESRQPSSPLRELTLFAFDPAARSVVIGAALFEKSKVGGGIVPRVTEEGGTAPFFADGERKIGLYQARPHLGPAFKAEMPKAAPLFKDMIR